MQFHEIDLFYFTSFFAGLFKKFWPAVSGDDLKSDFLNLLSRSEAGDPVRLVSWWFSRNIQANPIGVNVDAVRDIIKIFGRKPDNAMNGTLKVLVKIPFCFSTIEIWVRNQ